MELNHHDALIVVDVQNDFLPGGSMAVPGGDQIIPVLNGYIALFGQRGLPVFATRDWHPPGHCSFSKQGGSSPQHCLAASDGAAFPASLELPPDAILISKATRVQADAYSGFQGTDLAEQLRARGVKRVFVGGLATDYCVLNTVLDALGNRFRAMLLVDAIRAVNMRSRDGESAIVEMLRCGAQALMLPELDEATESAGAWWRDGRGMATRGAKPPSS